MRPERTRLRKGFFDAETQRRRETQNQRGLGFLCVSAPLRQKNLSIVLYASLIALTACSHPPTVTDSLAFVANSQDNSVSLIDLSNMKLTATIPVAPEPVALAPSLNRVWVLSKGG